MGKKVLILAGVSGVGKTYQRTTDPALRDLPHVDIADIYKAAPLLDWNEAFHAFTVRLERLLERHDTVVAEGYFIPGSVTRGMLKDTLEWLGVEHEFIDLHASLHTCRSRVASSGVDVGKRTEVLERVWPKAEAQYRRREESYVYTS